MVMTTDHSCLRVEPSTGTPSLATVRVVKRRVSWVKSSQPRCRVRGARRRRNVSDAEDAFDARLDDEP